jgi:hypothetical protein
MSESQKAVVIHASEFPSDCKWPSYNNIHKELLILNRDNGNVDAFFQNHVNITIKIDGSNLGIHIKKESGEWNIKKLKGRNSTIWSERDKIQINKLPKYGGIDLKNLPDVMFEFASSFAQHLKLDEIIVYGEVICVNKFSSWHPFGYMTKNGFVLLTSELQEQFQKLTIGESSSSKVLNVPTFNSPDEMMNYLKNIKSHVVFPPPSLFSGKLNLGINHLHTKMNVSEHKHKFEGVFVVIEKTNDNGEYLGFKWKTGFFEEQHNIPLITDLGFKTDEANELYSKLVEIFMTRPDKENRVSLVRSSEVKTKAANMKQSVDQLKKEIATTYERELTKTSSFVHIPKNDRHIIVESMTKRVVDEIKKQYLDAEEQIPWDNEMIERLAKSCINVSVMKTEYVLPDDETADERKHHEPVKNPKRKTANTSMPTKTKSAFGTPSRRARSSGKTEAATSKTKGMTLDEVKEMINQTFLLHTDILQVGDEETKCTSPNIEEIKFPKDTFDGKGRKKITMYAESLDLCSFTETITLDNNEVEFLIIKKTKNEYVDKENPSEMVIKEFGFYHQLEFSISKEDFLHELKIMNLETSFNDFCTDITKYGIAGLKRFYFILTDEIAEYIQSLEGYKNLLKSKPTSLDFNDSKQSKFTICNCLYKPHNENKSFVSLDISAAVHRAYMEKGIITDVWTVFMQKFTKSKFLSVNKQLRLQIYGRVDKANMNRIMFSNLIVNVANEIKDKIEASGYKILSVEGDEILMEPPENLGVTDFEMYISNLHLPNYINAMFFTLKYFPKDVNIMPPFYVKLYKYPANKRFEIKCLNRAFHVKAYSIMCDNIAISKN